MNLYAWLLILCLAAGCTLAGRSLFHFYQLGNYQFRGYRQSVQRSWRRMAIPALVMAAAVLLSLLDARVIPPLWLGALLFALAVLGAGLVLDKRMRDSRAKKALVITDRVKRLYAIQLLTHLLLLRLLCAACGVTSAGQLLRGSVGTVAAFTAYPLLMPLWVFLAALLAWPVELFIRHLYFRDAQRVLRERKDLIRIGITGSYGKTSVKFILGKLLEEKYQVLVTPSSFNTPMGLARVIRNDLRPTHQVFIAEMGARHRGDIRELCRLVHPGMGVLTSVGPQHLDTFKTLANIRETKYDLIRAIPEEGCCFFANDNGVVRSLYDRTEKKKRLSSVRACSEADVWAEDISVSSTGCTFRLYTSTGSVTCETSLLGEHNISNILLAASVALEMGLSLKEIRRGIARLTPVPHRLQLIPGSNGITVIDDAFNSNPRGANAALDTLALFDGRRIVITPGMVELGEREAEINRDFGRRMARSADVAVLVGAKHTAPIREGLLAGGFDPEAIHTVGSLQEAQTLVARMGQAGDVLLLENDLPDNYTE